MYLNLGNKTVVDTEGIIGIFDLDITSQSHLTRKYLRESDKAGLVINAAEDIPRSFVVYCSGDRRAVYLSQMSTATLQRRTASGII